MGCGSDGPHLNNIYIYFCCQFLGVQSTDVCFMVDASIATFVTCLWVTLYLAHLVKTSSASIYEHTTLAVFCYEQDHMKSHVTSICSCCVFCFSGHSLQLSSTVSDKFLHFNYLFFLLLCLFVCFSDPPPPPPLFFLPLNLSLIFQFCNFEHQCLLN